MKWSRLFSILPFQSRIKAAGRFCLKVRISVHRNPHVVQMNVSFTDGRGAEALSIARFPGHAIIEPIGQVCRRYAQETEAAVPFQSDRREEGKTGVHMPGVRNIESTVCLLMTFFVFISCAGISFP